MVDDNKDVNDNELLLPAHQTDAMLHDTTTRLIVLLSHGQTKHATCHWQCYNQRELFFLSPSFSLSTWHSNAKLDPSSPSCPPPSSPLFTPSSCQRKVRMRKGRRKKERKKRKRKTKKEKKKRVKVKRKKERKPFSLFHFSTSTPPLLRRDVPVIPS